MDVQSGGLDINETVGNAISKEMNDMAGAIDRLTNAVQNAKSSTKTPIEIGVKLKTAVNMDLNSGATLKKTLDQVEKQVDKIFKKRAIQATLQIAEPGKYGSTARTEKYSSLVSNAKAQGYTGNDLKKIENIYDTILRTMSAISLAQSEIDNFNFKNYHDLENYVNLITQLYNSRKQLGELNKTLPQDLQISDTYKNFKEMSHVPKFNHFLIRYKESAIDAIYTNSQLVDSIKRIIDTGRELTEVDLFAILGDFAKNNNLVTAEKQTKRVTQNIQKYFVDMETALEKTRFFAKKAEKGTLGAQGEKDLVGYYTSYLAQGGTAVAEYEQLLKAYGNTNKAKMAQQAIQEAIKEGILAQIAEQQKLNAEKEKTAELQKKIQDTKVVDTNTQKQIQNQEQLTNAVQKTVEVRKQEVKSIEESTAAIERQQKVATTTPKLKTAAFNIPNQYIVNQLGDTSQDDESWKYLVKLNEFQTQTVRNAQDQDGEWHVIFSRIFTDFKQLSAEITKLDTVILKTQNDLNNLGKTKIGKLQDQAPLLAQIAAQTQMRDALLTMAQKVGNDPAYAADYWQFVKDRQDNTAQVTRGLAIANSKQDAKLALEAANAHEREAKAIEKTNFQLDAYIDRINKSRNSYASLNVSNANRLNQEAQDFINIIEGFRGRVQLTDANKGYLNTIVSGFESQAAIAKKAAEDAIKQIETAEIKLESLRHKVQTIQAGYTSGKSMIPSDFNRQLLDSTVDDINKYINSYIGKNLTQQVIHSIEDKIADLQRNTDSFRIESSLNLNKDKLASEIDGLLEKLKASKEPTGQFQLALEKIRKALSMPLEKSQFDDLKNTFDGLKTSIKTAEDFAKKTKEVTKAISDYRNGLAQSGNLTAAISTELNKLSNQLSNVKTVQGVEAVGAGLKQLQANASSLPKTVSESFDVMLHKMYELTDALNKIKELQALQAVDPTISYKSQITAMQKIARQLQDELFVMKPESFIQKNIQQIGQTQINEYKQLKEEARQAAEAIGSIGSNIGGFSGTNNSSNKIEQLKKALKDLYNEQLNLTKLSNGKIINTEAIAQSENQIKSLSSTVANLRKEVEQTYGVNVADTIIQNINQDYSTKFTSAFGKTLQDYVNSVEKFKAQFTSAQYGEFGAMMAKNIQPQIEGIQHLAKEYQILEQQIKTTANVADLTHLNQQKQILGEQIATRVNDLENLSFSSLFKQLEKLGSFANSSGKIGAYSQKLGELHRELASLANEKLSGNLGENYTERFQKLLNDIAHFASTADSWNLEQKNGFLNLGATNIKDIDDLSAAMAEYANTQGLVIDNNKQIDKNYKNQTVTQYYRNQNKELVQLTGTLKENMGYVKQLSLGHTGLMGDWGAAFGGFAKQLASYYTGYQAFTRIMREAKEGLNVLKQYDAALTDMSYSMNVTEKDLDRLGSSAVAMAKDLSTSLEDTLGIYQIYANMNTSIQEIEDTAKPTAILSNLGGINALEASDQIQGVLQQFNMIEEGAANAAEASMHVVDVFDNIASNVSIDYVKGMQTISEAVTATGSVAYDAGMSFEQLAAVTAKVAERTREDGSTIGNAIKTIVTRISKVGKMPAYADEVSNEELSKASEALNEIGIAVYNADGSFRELDVILTELRDKWDGLTDAQQANLSFQIAATRQTSKFKNILESWTEAMSIADTASVISGNAEANQKKYEESVNGKLQKIATQWDAFWLSVYDSKTTDLVLDFLIKLTGGIDNLSQSLGGGLTAATLFFNLFAIKGKFLKKGALSQPKTRLQTYIIIIKWAYYHKEYYIMA